MQYKKIKEKTITKDLGIQEQVLLDRKKYSGNGIQIDNGYRLNSTLSPSDIYGISGGNMGIIYFMRTQNPFISAVMNDKRDSVSNLRWEFRPKNSECIECIRHAIAFTQIFDNLYSGNLSTLVAGIYDEVMTYGSSLIQFVFVDNKLRFVPIPHREISTWTMDEFNVDLKEFRLHNGQTLSANEEIPTWAWIGKKRDNADYHGDSQVLSLLDFHVALMKEMECYLGERGMNKGILVGGFEPGMADEAGVRSLTDAMISFYQEENYPFILPPGASVNYVQANSPGVTIAPEMIRLIQETLNKTLGQNLNALSNYGSRALGEVINSEELKRSRNHIDYFTDIVNGNVLGADPIQFLFKRICMLFEDLDPEYTPVLVCTDNSETAISETVENVTSLVDSEVLAPSDIAAEAKEQMFEELGLDPGEYRDAQEGNSEKQKNEKEMENE